MKLLSDFDLRDVIAIFIKWKLILISFISTAMLLTILIVFFILPKKYLATAVCLPSNPVLADRSFIFNENIQNLYATYGSSPQLDRLTSTAHLDTLYRYAVQTFDLKERYKVTDKGLTGLNKTINEFKKHYNVEKTVLGELKVHVWDESALQSAEMANRLIDKIEALSSQKNNNYNNRILDALKKEYKTKKTVYLNISDSLNRSNITEAERELIQLKKKSISTTLIKYEELINEFSVAVRASASSLQVQEYASPQAKPAKPRKAYILLLAFILSCLFAILMMFTLEQRKK